MYARILTRPIDSKKSFFLFGPRGTGKTTWLKQNFSEAVYIDLLGFFYYNALLADPGRLEEYIPPRQDVTVIIDEIQKVPALLNEVHRLIESKKVRFILTGSSARSLRRKGVNLLAGRAYTYNMYPLTVQELGSDFSLARALASGFLPASYAEANPEEFLKSYVQTYLREEILQEGITRNLSAFARFLEIASFSQGSLLNISEVARDAGIERKTVENYFSILQDMLIADLLPSFTKKSKRRLMRHGKFYFFDAGIYRSIRPAGPLDSPEYINGAALETLVYQELRALNDYGGHGYALHYWRTSTGLEVDFVLYGENGIIALEVKSSGTWREKDLSGLRAFQEDYPPARCYLFYGGNVPAYSGNVTILPVIDGLRKLPEILSAR